MNSEIAMQMLVGVIGGLGIFLLGMKQMSEGMQAVTGERLRKLIRAVTDNRLVATGVGASITAMIQSSSVTTVMVVGMVNANIMNLKQAVGVVMGTNIGTTITAWIIALHIADYGLLILGIATFFYLFSKSEILQFTAMAVVGLGMVFFGLELMKNGFYPLREMPEVHNMMAAFEPRNLAGILKCLVVGAGVTAIIQSSSATVAITITLATTGTITYETAVALVLGENIGTTITAFLASLGANRSAKQTALAHFMFNLTGVMIMIPLFRQYLWLLTKLAPDTMPIAARIATSHSYFNLFVLALLLPLLTPFTKLIITILPNTKRKEKPHLTHLDIRLVESPAIAIQQSKSVIETMGKNVEKMMTWLKEAIEDNELNRPRENKIFHRENVLDIMQKEVVEFISNILGGNLSHDVTTRARNQLRIADEYESVSDYIVTITKLICRMRNDNLEMSDQGKSELLAFHDQTSAYIRLISSAVCDRNQDILTKAMAQGDELGHTFKNIRTSHLNRLEDKKISPYISLIYMDILSAYKRIKDHTFNIAEVMAGEK